MSIACKHHNNLSLAIFFKLIVDLVHHVYKVFESLFDHFVIEIELESVLLRLLFWIEVTTANNKSLKRLLFQK